MSMFQSRNSFYLRINTRTVLPVFLHLDEQNNHTEWMSEDTLKQVIEDLRPLIGEKIRAEDEAASRPGPASSKKTSGVDVHRGAWYQFAYYLQKADHHNVLVKQRNYALAPPVTTKKSPSAPENASTEPSGPRTKSRATRKKSTMKKNTRGKKRRREESSSERELSDRESEDDAPVVASAAPRRSARVRKAPPAPGAYQEVNDDETLEDGTTAPKPLFLDAEDNDEIEGTDDSPPVKVEGDDDDSAMRSLESAPAPPSGPFEVEDDEESEKQKLQLEIRYQGFSISRWRLVLIVQPYPPLHQTHTSSNNNDKPRAPSLMPSRQGSILSYTRNREREVSEVPSWRGGTPLFREPTPALRQGTPLFREPTPAFSTVDGMDEAEEDRLEDAQRMEDDDDDGSLEGLVRLTQSFRATRSDAGGLGGGADNDLDADEDGVFMQDADERAE